MAFLSRPDFYFGLAFNADPNDPVAVPIWTDFTNQVRSLSQLARGKQYELAQIMSAAPEVTIRDPAEALNPDNTGSPYYPNIVPYRETLLLGQWPNYGGVTPPSGSTNLLNLNTWQNPIDPSFESYTAGTVPGFIINSGATGLGVVAANPHGGTKSFQFSVLDNLSLQTVSWPLKCIPGRQYTSSFWFRMSQTPATNVLPMVRGCTQIIDQFARTVANGWGTAGPVGGAWSTNGGVAADYSVAGGLGLIKQSSTGVTRMTFQGGAFTDHNTACYLNIGGVTPAGAAVRAGVVARGGAGGVGYIAAADFNPDGSIVLNLIKDVSGVETILTSVTTPYTYDPTINYGIRIDTQGTQIQGKIWPETITEPPDYNVITTDGSIAALTAAGCYSQSLAGNTNGVFSVRFDNLNVVAAATGTSTLTVGSYVRLSVTFTANQPDHTASMTSTRHVGATQVINIDDIQLDQAATAQTVCTTGPVINPIMRNLAERFTRSYDETGFEGIATLPCVDALAALSATSISSEYQEALNALFPRFSWPLNDSGGGTSFAEVVSGGPSLVARNGSAATLTGQLTPGAQFSIPGYPGQTGAQIAGNTDTFQGMSLVANGISGIAQNGSVALTIAFWAQWTANRSTTQALFGLGNKNTSGFYVLQPAGMTNTLQIQANNNGAISTTPLNAGNLGDGRPHFVVVTFAQTAGASLLIGELFVDGSVVNPLLSASLGAPNYNVSQLAIAAGTPAAPGTGSGINGTYAQVHVWNRVLSAAEVFRLWQAGQGFVGELSGVRVARHLALGQYAGISRIDSGTQAMGPASYAPSIDLGTDLANNTAAENGDFWIAPDGAVVFEGSSKRYLRTTSIATLGDNPAGGEAPYESGVTFDDDPTFIYANVQVSRPNGINAVGGSLTDIQAAQRRFFGRPLAITVDVQTDTQAQSLANWTFYTHNRPQTRVAKITLTPSANPTLWQFALGLEIGNRITVTKRSKAANGGAGITVTQDYFIEQIVHDGVDFDLSTWTTTFSVSPIGSATSGNGQTVQPWIVGNATYGVIGVTSIPGY